MNYKYYILMLFFINSYSLHGSDRPPKRVSSLTQERMRQYAEKTRNSDLIDSVNKRVSDPVLKKNTDQHNPRDLEFKEHIQTITEWNAQKNNDGGAEACYALFKIAQNIEIFKTLTSYEEFKTLNLSKTIDKCRILPYYTNPPAPRLQTIKNALAAHNPTVNHINDQKTPSTTPSLVNAKQGQQDLTTIKTENQTDQAVPNEPITPPTLPENTETEQQQPPLQTPDPEPLTDTQPALQTDPAPEENLQIEQPAPEQQLDSAEIPAILTSTNPQELAPRTTDTKIDSLPNTPRPTVTQQKNNTPDPIIQQPKPIVASAPQQTKKALITPPYYKRPFLFLGGLGIFAALVAICCHRYCDKEALIDLFNNPQQALTFFRLMLSNTFTNSHK